MDALIAAFAPYGFATVVCAVLFWMVIRMQDRNEKMWLQMVAVVEKNTVAFGELKAVIEKCQVTHDR